MALINDITDLQLLLMIATACLCLMACTAILWRVVPLARHYKRQTKLLTQQAEEPVERASVIVFAHDDANSLAELLPRILCQNYQPGFEVIVVNDGESREVADIVSHLKNVHPNLYFTSSPEGARNLSRKKLSLTLGIKAANNPVVVNITSGAVVTSDNWLQGIMRHFRPDSPVEVVLGISGAPLNDDHAPGALARAFDSAIDTLSWTAPAAKGRPWRGTENNLAYRRNLFFDNKGFSSHLNLRDGDDDIFVSEIARHDNTALEITPDTFVEVPGENHPSAMSEQMSRRRFTRRYIRHRPRFAGVIASLCYALATLPLIATPIVGHMGLETWIVWGCLLALWFCTGLLWNPALRILHARRKPIFTPLWALTRPIRIVNRRLRSMIIHTKHYTWE